MRQVLLRTGLLLALVWTTLAPWAYPADSSANGKVERKGPLAGLPSPAGPHLEKLKALGDNSWLNLGAPAPDPQWGRGMGRSWSPRMPYASDLRGAFLFGEGGHGWVNPEKRRSMDDLWFYDVNAHRWICLYPGTSIDSPASNLSINADGFTATSKGEPVPICTMVHCYEVLTYDPDRKRFMSWNSPMYAPQEFQNWRNRKDWYGPCKAEGSPWFYDTVAGKWGREPLKGTYPSNTSLGDMMIYVPSKKQIFYHAFGSSRNHSYFYDPASNQWSEVPTNWTDGPSRTSKDFPDGGDVGACYDSKRDRIYVGKHKRLWFFDLKTNTWTDPKPSGDFNLLGTHDSVMNYDSANDKVVTVSIATVRKVQVYDAATNAFESTAGDVPQEISQMNGFYDPVLNVYFFNAAQDNREGVIWAYRYKSIGK